MKNLSKLSLTLCSMFVLITSCDDIFEEDISDDTVVLETPADGLIIEANSLLFSWNDLDDVDEYQFQLRNQETGIVIIDSLVVESQIDLALDPQVYSWRVKGINFAFETDFTFPREVTILLPSGLAGQDITLLSPEDETFLNASSSVLLDWEALEDAIVYDISIDRDVDGVVINELLETGVEETSLSLDVDSFENDGLYRWSVRGLNDDSQTSFMERVFSIDREEPSIVSLTTPEVGVQFAVNEEITFEWTIIEDTGVVQSPIQYFLQVSDSDIFENIIQEGDTAENTIDFSGFNEVGTYWWRLMSIDEAGNESDYTEARNFIVE